MPDTGARERAYALGFWNSLFSGDGFMPRRHCGTWDSFLVGLHVVSDVVIWLSYLWIPLVMLGSYYAHKKHLHIRGPILWLLLLYVIFITACGWTHFFDALMFWEPVYRANGVVRALTAVVSLATAVSLVRLVPQAITAPVTIITQQAALHQQNLWLRDILDSATGGVLKLCEASSDLPAPLADTPETVAVANESQLRAVRQSVQGLAARAGFDRGRTGDLLTAAHEAAMNALRHAGGARVRSYGTDETVQVWVEDEGSGIPLDKLPISTLKQGYSTAGTAGQGWFLVLTFVDAAYLLTGPTGTTVVLEMGREQPHQSVPFSEVVGGDVRV